MDFYKTSVGRYWKWILAATLVGFMIASLLILTTRPTYQAEAQLFVGTTATSTDSIGLNQSGQFAQQRVKSYVELVTTPEVLDPVIRDLGLKISAEQFASSVTASAPVDTVIVDIRVNSVDPAFAQEAANRIGRRFAAVAPVLETSAGDKTAPVAVRLVRPATRPTMPITEAPITTLVIGAAAGLLLGLGLALILHAAFPGYFRKSDVRDQLGLEVLMEMRSPVRRGGKKQSPLALDAVRFLTVRLDALGQLDDPFCLLLTSGDDNRDSTQLASDLAQSYARTGRRTVIVDLGLGHERVAGLLGLSATNSLDNVLAGQPIIWDDSTVTIVQQVPPSPRSKLVYAGSGLDSTLAHLRHNADVVIISAPSVRVDAESLAWAGSTQFVKTLVHFRRGTSKSVVNESVAMLRAVQADLVGVALYPESYIRAQQRSKSGAGQVTDLAVSQ